jgi:hypothetical protein
MGVDIYLNSIWEPFWSAFEGSLADGRLQKEVDRAMAAHDIEKATTVVYDAYRASGGYFRNGYNAGDVMWAMGLSWSGDVGPMLDAKHFLSIENARKLVAMIEARPLTRERIARHILEHMTDGKGPHPVTGPTFALMNEAYAEATGDAAPPLRPPDFEKLSTFLLKRREELLVILRKSIELDEPLEISL